MIDEIKKNIKNIDFTIFLSITILVIYSIILLYSSSNNNIFIIFKRIIHIIIGYILMIILSNLNSEYYKNNSLTFYFISIILLIIVYTHGYISKGAQRWINLKLIKFQPSEILKLSLPILISKIIYKEYPIKGYKKILKTIIITLLPSILIYLQPDLGTTILIILYNIIALYLHGINKKIILLSIIISILSIPISWKFLLHKYQKDRIISLFNKNNIFNKGYQNHQSKIAIGSGGIYGKGIFSGTQIKFNFIPENKTDFIFCLIAEEYGFMGICLLLLIYSILIIKCIIISLNNKDKFNQILISNLIINFFIHIIINISMVNGLIPIVGIPLPLLSYGGTSLITNMSMFGIIMSLQNKNI